MCSRKRDVSPHIIKVPPLPTESYYENLFALHFPLSNPGSFKFFTFKESRRGGGCGRLRVKNFGKKNNYNDFINIYKSKEMIHQQ